MTTDDTAQNYPYDQIIDGELHTVHGPVVDVGGSVEHSRGEIIARYMRAVISQVRDTFRH